MVIVANNITLEKVIKSNYWDLIAILVWNHYSEKKFQDNSMIEIKENWYGKARSGSSHSNHWNDPNYSEPGYVRTLGNIVITFKRSDYITSIYINVNGNIYTFGYYTDTNIQPAGKSPVYEGVQRNLDLTNWMIKNNMLKIIK